MRLKAHNQRAFTLVEIMVVVVIVGLLAALAVPNFVQSRESTRTNTCISNLYHIAASKVYWSLDTNPADGVAPSFNQLSSYFRGSSVKVYCGLDDTETPDAGYTINDLNSMPICLHDPQSHTIQLAASNVGGPVNPVSAPLISRPANRASLVGFRNRLNMIRDAINRVSAGDADSVSSVIGGYILPGFPGRE